MKADFAIPIFFKKSFLVKQGISWETLTKGKDVTKKEHKDYIHSENLLNLRENILKTLFERRICTLH